jgi:nucleoid-associated protein YgaU
VIHRWRLRSSVSLAFVTIAALVACERGDADPSPTPTATIDDTFVIVTLTPDPSARRTPTVEVTRTYVVEEGDTLSSIAAAFGMTEEALIEANGLTDPDSIQAGQVLVIPSVDEPESE